MNIDNSYRIGRCNHCTSRTVYAWKASTGLRLEDVRCPRCLHVMDRTSRMAHRIVTFTDEQVVDQRATAIKRCVARAAESDEVAAAWREDEQRARDTDDEAGMWRAQFRAESYEKSAAESRKSMKRLARAHHARVSA